MILDAEDAPKGIWFKPCRQQLCQCGLKLKHVDILYLTTIFMMYMFDLYFIILALGYKRSHAPQAMCFIGLPGQASPTVNIVIFHPMLVHCFINPRGRFRGSLSVSYHLHQKSLGKWNIRR